MAGRKAYQDPVAGITCVRTRDALTASRGRERVLAERVTALEDFVRRLEDVVTIIDRRTRHLLTPAVILPPATATPPARVPPKEARKVRKLTDADASQAYGVVSEHMTSAQDADALNRMGFRRVVTEGS